MTEEINNDMLYSENSNANTSDGLETPALDAAVHEVDENNDVLDKAAKEWATSFMEILKSCNDQQQRNEFIKQTREFLKLNPDEQIAKAVGMDAESLGINIPSEPTDGAPRL